MLEKASRCGRDGQWKDSSVRQRNVIWHSSNENFKANRKALIPRAFRFLGQKRVAVGDDALADAEACYPITDLCNGSSDVGTKYEGVREGKGSVVLNLVWIRRIWMGEDVTHLPVCGVNCCISNFDQHLTLSRFDHRSWTDFHGGFLCDDPCRLVFSDGRHPVV